MRKTNSIKKILSIICFIATNYCIAQTTIDTTLVSGNWQGNWQCVAKIMVDDQNQPIKDNYNMNFDNAELPMFPENVSIDGKNIILSRLNNTTLKAMWQTNSNFLQINDSTNQTIAQFKIIQLTPDQLIIALPKKDPEDKYSLQLIFNKKK